MIYPELVETMQEIARSGAAAEQLQERLLASEIDKQRIAWWVLQDLRAVGARAEKWLNNWGKLE